jgi:NAD(P)-dependent dehydrogenase (short-subunit alcohol dehydrogenase family)
MSTQTAWVTGSSRGIGKAIAVALAQAGFDVIISARTVHTGEAHDYTDTVHRSDVRTLPGSLDETAAIIESHGRRALQIPMDLTDLASVGAAAQRVLDTWGGVDAVIHNGRYLGPGLMDTFMDVPFDGIRKMVDAHLLAPIVITRALLPAMLERGRGHVFTISSGAARNVPPGPAGRGGWGLAYAAGKAAGHAMALTLRAEFGSNGIRAINVEPGNVATERKKIAQQTGRAAPGGAPPEVVGAAIAWLLSDPQGLLYDEPDADAQALAAEHGLYAIA